MGSYAELACVDADQLVPLPGGGGRRDRGSGHAPGNDRSLPRPRGPTPCLKVKSPSFTPPPAASACCWCKWPKRAGARVIGTVSTGEKERLAREAGADDVIRYNRGGVRGGGARAYRGAKGVDVIYDSVGRTTFLKGLELLRPRGCMVLFGQSSGPVEPFNPQLLSANGSLFLTRPTMAHYLLTRDELLQRAGDVLNWIENGELSLRIGGPLPTRRGRGGASRTSGQAHDRQGAASHLIAAGGPAKDPRRGGRRSDETAVDRRTGGRPAGYRFASARQQNPEKVARRPIAAAGSGSSPDRPAGDPLPAGEVSSC